MDDEDNSIYLNDLFTLEAGTTAWAQPATTGEPPIQREGHTASVIGSQMIVFGGAGLDSEERSVRALPSSTPVHSCEEPALQRSCVVEARRRMRVRTSRRMRR